MASPSKAVITSVGSAISGGTTISTTPVVAGNADAGTIVYVYDGVRMIGSTTAGANGTWTFTPAAALKAGSHAFTAISTDSAGNSGASSEPLSVMVGSVTVSPPVITGLFDTVGPIQGQVVAGSTIDDPRPTMTGTGKAGDVIKVYDNGTLIGSATVGADGKWTVIPTVALADGAHSLYAIESNGSGTSVPSAAIGFTVDTHVPTTPNAPSLTNDSGLPIVAGSTTNDAHPHINGTGTAGDIIKVLDNGTVIGSTTVKADGTWTFTPSPDLSSGAHDITVIETSPAGNSSAASNPTHITIDTSVPATPAVPVLTDDSGTLIPAGSTTNDGHPHISGTGTAGDIITVYDGATAIGSVKIGSDGKWTFTPATDLSNTSHTITVTDTNAVGTVSPHSGGISFTVDTTLPNAPVISQMNDYRFDNGAFITAVPSGSTVTSANVSFGGTAKANGTVYVYDGATLVASVVADSNGTWSYASKTYANGLHDMSATQKSPAGVETAHSNHWTFTLNAVIPATPTVPVITNDAGTTIPAGGTTSDAHPHIAGTGTAGDIITVLDNGTVIGSTTIAANGTWSFTPSPDLPSGTNAITVIETNPSGNSSAVSPPATIVIDTSTPATPAVPVVTDDSGALVPAGSTTNDAHPHISGTGTAGDIIKVYDYAGILGSVIVGADGKWTLTADMPLSQHKITVTETNLAGTVSAHSDAIIFTTASSTPAAPATPVITALIDVVGPFAGNVAPGGTSSDSQPTLKGTGHAGDTINVFDGATLLGTTTVGSDGTWSFKPGTALATGVTHNLSASETNAGGTSAATSPYPVYVDTTYANDKIVITGVYDTSGNLVPQGGTVYGNYTVTGWFAGTITSEEGALRIYVNGNRVSNTATIVGNTFSIVIGKTSVSGFSATGSVPISAAYHDATAGWWATADNPAYSNRTTHGYTIVQNGSYSATRDLSLTESDSTPVAVAVEAAVVQDSTTSQTEHHTVVGEHDAFKGTTGYDTVDLDADPTSYFKESTAHIEGSTAHPVDTTGVTPAVNTLHLTGDHQVLDLTSLTGQTAAAKISGIEVIDLGGQHNTLKLSLVDVLNLGEADLFVKDGKQQMMVNGKEGDEVDLSNSHIAGLADGDWQAHGTAEVGGVTYNVYEHSGTHTELLVQQGVQIVVH